MTTQTCRTKVCGRSRHIMRQKWCAEREENRAKLSGGPRHFICQTTLRVCLGGDLHHGFTPGLARCMVCVVGEGVAFPVILWYDCPHSNPLSEGLGVRRGTNFSRVGTPPLFCLTCHIV